MKTRPHKIIQNVRYRIDLLIAPIALRHFSEAPSKVLKKRMQLKVILKLLLFTKKIIFLFIYNYNLIKYSKLKKSIITILVKKII